MKARRPVLVNREVLNSKMIETLDIGYLVSYGDIDELVSIIKYIKSHPDEANRKGQNGRALFETKFNWPLMEKEIEKILIDLKSQKQNL